MGSTKSELCISVMQNHDKFGLKSLTLDVHTLELRWVWFLIFLFSFSRSHHRKPFFMLETPLPLLLVVSGNLIDVMVVANLEKILVDLYLFKFSKVWMLPLWTESESLLLVFIILPVCSILRSLAPLIQQCRELLIVDYWLSVFACKLFIGRRPLPVIFGCTFVRTEFFLVIWQIWWFLVVYCCEWFLIVCRSKCSLVFIKWSLIGPGFRLRLS